MKSYKGLTFRYLKTQAKRTALTIFGVILSIALITAIGTMLKSLENHQLEKAKRDNGFYHTRFYDINEEKLNQLRNNPSVDTVGFNLLGGYAKVVNKGYVKVSSYDNELKDIMYLNIIQGKMPEKSDEIAVEGWILEEMPGKLKIGDSIKLNIEDVDEEEILDRMYNAEKEKIEKKPTTAKSYKIVGIIENNSRSQMKGIAKGVVAHSAVYELKGKDSDGIAFIRIKNKLPIQDSIKELRKSVGIKENRVQDNSRLLTLLAQSQNKEVNESIVLIIGFLVTLIVIATSAVIYNSFNISVLERIKQFGILRSIGTTPSQIRSIVLGEAMTVAIIALPLGIFSGVIAVKIVISILNSISSLSIFNEVRVVVSPSVLLISGAVGVVSVLSSALNPAFLAGRVSPIQAIMNTKGDRKKIKRIKRSPFIRKLFGIEGEMAYKNLKRNKKRFYITVFSMCIGIVIFIVFNTFVYYSFEGAHGRDPKFGDFTLYHSDYRNNNGFTEKDYNDIKGINGVTQVYKNHTTDVTLTFPADKLTEEYKMDMTGGTDGKIEMLEDNKHFKPMTSTRLIAYDRGQFEEAKQYLESGTLDENEINREKGIVIVNTLQTYDDKGKIHIYKVTNLKVGDYIYLDTKLDFFNAASEQEQKNDVNGLQKVKVVGILEKYAFGDPYPSNSIGVVTTEKILKNFKDTYRGFDIVVDQNADKKVIKERLTEIAKGVRTGGIIDYAGQAEQDKQIKLGMQVLLYGFVTVIALIGVLNIVNTISTNLILRTREFGTQRAVGMTMGQMKRMTAYEGVLYGIIGAFWGTLVGTGLAYVLYKFVIRIVEMPWKLPIDAILISTIGTVIVTLLSTLVPLKRVSKMNIIEAIGREE